MPLAEDRELIQVSTIAYEHLRAVVAATRKLGIPTSGTLIASTSILSIPIPPEPQTTIEKKRAPRKSVTAMSTVVSA